MVEYVACELALWLRRLQRTTYVGNCAGLDSVFEHV